MRERENVDDSVQLGRICIVQEGGRGLHSTLRVSRSRLQKGLGRQVVVCSCHALTHLLLPLPKKLGPQGVGGNMSNQGA